MTYELAKQLKDAGFPQKEKLTGDIIALNGIEYPDFPTLSELIDECGDGFSQLHKWDDGDWAAFSESNWGNAPDGKECIGETPTEAVAKLWLELNKKLGNVIFP